MQRQYSGFELRENLPRRNCSEWRGAALCFPQQICRLTEQIRNITERVNFGRNERVSLFIRRFNTYNLQRQHKHINSSVTLYLRLKHYTSVILKFAWNCFRFPTLVYVCLNVMYFIRVGTAQSFMTRNQGGCTAIVWAHRKQIQRSYPVCRITNKNTFTPQHRATSSSSFSQAYARR